VLGVAVVANRIGGYSPGLFLPIQPLLTTIANVLFAVAWRGATGKSIRRHLTPLTQVRRSLQYCTVLYCTVQ